MHTFIWISIMIKKIPHSIHIFFGTNCNRERCITYSKIIKSKVKKIKSSYKRINIRSD
jgi:hypothetical protein